MKSEPHGNENIRDPLNAELKGASQLLEVIDHQNRIANQICLTLHCNLITQCVHMPLLRLINQCVGIGANISETRLRLKQIVSSSMQSRIRNGRNNRGHRKQDSAASSSQNSSSAPPGGAVTPAGSDKSADFSGKSKQSRRSTIGRVNIQMPKCIFCYITTFL